MIDQFKFLSDNSTDILYQHSSDVKWEPYNKLHVANYKRVHYDTKSDVVVLKIRSKENIFTCECVTRRSRIQCMPSMQELCTVL